MNYTHCGNTTDMCAGPKHGTEWMGWVGAIIAVVFFGSNFIPVKKFNTGDGKNCVDLSTLLSYSSITVCRELSRVVEACICIAREYTPIIYGCSNDNTME